MKKQEKTKEEYLEMLKATPRVYEFVKKHIDDDELIGMYCYNLMKDTREGQRKGFPVEVAEALFYFGGDYESPPTVWDFI